MQATQEFVIKSKQCNIDALTEEQIQQLEEIKDNCEMIVLKGSSYSKAFFLEFSDYIVKLTNLRRVNTNDIFVGRGKDEIPESLHLLSKSLIGKQIMSIDFSNNAVNPFGAEAIKPFLKQASFLKVFLINNCGLGIQGVTHIAQGLQIRNSYILKGLAEGSHNLEVFAIARNRVEDEGANQIAAALKSLKNLRELHIYQNGIKEAGMVPLLTSLSENCSFLDVLDVRDNFLHPNSALALSLLLSKAKQLKGLNISDCNLTTKSNEAILSALENSTFKIEKLGYNYAELNDQQGVRLLEFLIRNIQTLQKVDIKGNDFKSATKKRFKQSFEQKQKVMSAFSSDDEDDNEALDELTREFSLLQV